MTKLNRSIALAAVVLTTLALSPAAWPATPPVTSQFQNLCVATHADPVEVYLLADEGGWVRMRPKDSLSTTRLNGKGTETHLLTATAKSIEISGRQYLERNCTLTTFYGSATEAINGLAAFLGSPAVSKTDGISSWTYIQTPTGRSILSTENREAALSEGKVTISSVVVLSVSKEGFGLIYREDIPTS
jgi:hypothetical protein